MGAFVRAALTALALFLCLGGLEAGELTCEFVWTPPTSPDQLAQAAKRWPKSGPPRDSSCAEAWFRGEIASGDYDRFRWLLYLYHPYLEQIYLSSKGGDVREAIKIGRLLREYLMRTNAPIRSPNGSEYFLSSHASRGSHSYCKQPDDGCVCVDACALIFLGGVEEDGHIGFQSLVNPTKYQFSDYSMVRDEIRKYLDEIEATPYVKTHAFSTNEVTPWILFEDSRPISYAAWQDAKCGTWTAEENEAQLSLYLQALTPGKEPKLSPTQQILYEGLLEKKAARRDCMVKHKFNATELIEKPKVPLTLVEGPDGRTFEFPYYVSNEEMARFMSKIYPQPQLPPDVIGTGPDHPVATIPEQKGASGDGSAK